MIRDLFLQRVLSVARDDTGIPSPLGGLEELYTVSQCVFVPKAGYPLTLNVPLLDVYQAATRSLDAVRIRTESGSGHFHEIKVCGGAKG